MPQHGQFFASSSCEEGKGAIAEVDSGLGAAEQKSHSTISRSS
jgi:hypothetical protein